MLQGVNSCNATIPDCDCPRLNRFSIVYLLCVSKLLTVIQIWIGINIRVNGSRSCHKPFIMRLFWNHNIITLMPGA